MTHLISLRAQVKWPGLCGLLVWGAGMHVEDLLSSLLLLKLPLCCQPLRAQNEMSSSSSSGLLHSGASLDMVKYRHDADCTDSALTDKQLLSRGSYIEVHPADAASG